MNRQALLIGCPGVRGTNSYLGGVVRDLDNYNRFLRSPLGGAWYSSEIVSLDDPGESAVRVALQNLKSADYSLMLFSGHGYYSAQKRSTVICLHGDDEMDSIELRTGAKKHTLMLDCCRRVSRTVLAEDTLAKMDSMARSLSTTDCRIYYDRAISECPSGLIVLHSCDINETAGDDSRRGGYYAYSLIDVAEKWAESNKTDLSKEYSTLRIPRAHDGASDATRRLTSNLQNPQIEKPRSEPYFPFAIVA